MKRTMLIVEALSAVILLGSVRGGHSEDYPPTWQAIESEILASKMLENPSGTLKRHWTNSHNLLSLVANRDSGALIRLATVSTNPIVMLAAYHALRQVDTEHRALDLGLSLALRDDITNFFPVVFGKADEQESSRSQFMRRNR